MNLFLGIACLVLGGLWFFIPILSQKPFNPIKPTSSKSDSRNQLFESYLLLHDHLQKVGTPEQKAALEVVLGAIVVQEPQEV